MRTRIAMTFLWVAAAFALPQVARAQSLVVDNFTTGNHEVTLRSGVETHVQSGSMIGGFRQTHFLVADGAGNPFNQTGTLDIRPGGPMVVDMGTRVFHRLEVYYGVGPDGAIAPLNLNLSGFDRFVVNFDCSDSVLNFNLQIFSDSGATYSTLGYNLDPNQDPFSVDFPFASFKGEANFSDVDLIVLIFQAGNVMGAQDFAITSLSAATPLSNDVAGSRALGRATPIRRVHPGFGAVGRPEARPPT